LNRAEREDVEVRCVTHAVRSDPEQPGRERSAKFRRGGEVGHPTRWGGVPILHNGETWSWVPTSRH